MNIRFAYILVAICACIGINETQGQQLGSYYLQNLPQRNYQNPAFAPAGEMHVGMPVISSLSFQYTNNGFNYNDVFSNGENNKLILNIKSISESLNANNHLSLAFETDLLSAGIKIGKSYFSFKITEKINVDLQYSRQFMNFFMNGNASTMGIVQKLNPGLEAIHYREYGVTWSGRIRNNLNGGLRFKYLYGMEQAFNEGNGMNVYTDPDDFAITANADMQVYTSGLDTSAFSQFSIGDYAFGRKNNGFAIDLGFNWLPLKNLEVSGSVADAGFIKWNDHVTSYHSTPGNFEYHGINLNEFINNDSTNGEEYLQNLGDSLYNSLNVETLHKSYKYRMPVKMHFGVTYTVFGNIKAYVLLRSKMLNSGNLMDYQLGFSGKAGKVLAYVVNLNRINETPVTPGAGLTLNVRGTQVYFISDNIISLINWKNSYHTGFRAGVNMVFGTNKLPPQPVIN